MRLEVFPISTTAALRGGRMMKGRRMEKRGKRQAASIFGGMGFYIALLVCVLAAGVVGYYALLNNTEDSPSNEDTVQSVDQTDPGPATPVTTPDKEPSLPVISDQPVVIDRPVVTTRPEQDQAEDEPEEASTPTVNTYTPPVTAQEPSVVVAPLSGETVAVFSVDQLTYDATLGDWRTHDGIDIQAAAGTDVVATAAGTVLSVEEDGRLGTTVVIDHNNGYVTTYASLQPGVDVLAGDSVSAGTVIGAVGNTSLSEAGLGAHLHFSVTKDGEAVDPMEYLG